MTDTVLRRTSEALGLAGVGIAGYLTYVHYAGLHPICGISHGCETVQTSRYAGLVGIPVALLGLVTYVLILVSLRMRSEQALLGGYALTVIAFLFSAYLSYREVFTIHAICSWCVSSAIVFTLMAIVGGVRIVRVDAAETMVVATGTRLGSTRAP
jgi:uncharacterized membrane protein